MKPPIPNSYWVEPGLVLAGEHPDGNSGQATRERIEALLAAGVRSFIDLTEPDELPAYRELLPRGVSCENFPFPDHSVPRSLQHMRQVQVALKRLMASHAAVYVHCRAGIGRTGLVIGCYLREQGESGVGALAELNRLWQQNARAARWPRIPETPEQEQFIRNWMPLRVDSPDRMRDSSKHRLPGRPLERYRGCLLGLAVGDVAATGGSGDQPAAWSDETGTTICVAESLLEQGRFDGRDQLERYRDWALDPSAAGASPGAVLRPLVREVLARSVWNKSAVQGSHDPAKQDASPLARSTAAAMFAADDLQTASSLGADIARVTHQAPVPVDACRLLSGMICAALQGQSRETVLSVAQELDGMPLREELRVLAAGWTGPAPGRRTPPQGILGALDRAVRSFARSRNFDDGLERALVAPAADRDAVAASYGALAGAWYGEAAIPAGRRSRVAGLARVEALAEKLYQHAGAHGRQLA